MTGRTRPPRGMLRGSGMAATLGAAILLSGCSTLAPATAAPTTPVQTMSARPVGTPSQGPSSTGQRLLGGRPMADCSIGNGQSGLCGTLAVPEDPSRASGRKIGLKVVLVPALAARAAADAVFGLAGGPGGAGTTLLTWMPGTFSEIHAVRDIVLIDQRGTGGSNPIPMPPTPETAGLSRTAADARWSAWGRSLLGSLDADPRLYTSSMAADDIDAVRAALGYDEIDLYGPSYGATLALYYLRQHGDRVRVAVLDGGTPLDVPIFERIAANSQRSLGLVLDRCAADPACDAVFPRAGAELTEVLQRLKTPVTTTITDPATGVPGVLTRDDIASGVHSLLVNASSASVVPLAIHLVHESDWAGLAKLGASLTGGDSASSPLMSEVIRCSEAWARYDPDEVARLGSGSYYRDTQVAMAREQANLCRYVPAGVVAANDRDPVRTDVPVLWVVGEADPQDPPPNLAAIPGQMPNSRIVVVPGQGHTVGHLGCMPSVVGAVVAKGDATGLDVSCIDRGGVPVPTFSRP